MSQMKNLFTICHINFQLHRKNLPTIEKEAFPIFYALQKLDQYLHDSEFVIRTENKSLRYIMDSPAQNKMIQHRTHTHPWLQL